MRAARLLLVVLLPAATAARADAVEVLESVVLGGPLGDDRDLSAVETLGDVAWIASDEGAVIRVLDRVPGEAAWHARTAPVRLSENDDEIDLEGLAAEGRTVWAVGSHSLVRRRLDPGAPLERNRERLLDVAHHAQRDRLVRFHVDEAGAAEGAVETVSLRPLLEADPLLAPFCRIPGKENGIDVEGLAVAGGRLFAGLRSPVLRSGHVPVLVLDFDDPRSYELRLVDLDGRGIRGMDAVTGGFLLLAARERGDDGTAVYFWDGADQLPGAGRAFVPALQLGTLPPGGGASPEGIAVLAEAPEHWEALVVRDGSAGALRVRIPRPRR